ncbi:MAG: cold shock domain-containing protein [Deltaproteobacteria bacterium]|nr:cold shock domain-containing protein [Deltaproteobacteria bacterium]
MSKGTIRWFNYQKGYGFIENDEGGVVYFHYSAMKENDYYRLWEGQRVNFDVEESERSMCATNVTSIR